MEELGRLCKLELERAYGQAPFEFEDILVELAPPSPSAAVEMIDESIDELIPQTDGNNSDSDDEWIPPSDDSSGPSSGSSDDDDDLISVPDVDVGSDVDCKDVKKEVQVGKAELLPVINAIPIPNTKGIQMAVKTPSLSP